MMIEALASSRFVVTRIGENTVRLVCAHCKLSADMDLDRYAISQPDEWRVTTMAHECETQP